MLFWISGEVSVPSEKRTVWMPKGLINASPKPAKVPHPSAIRRRLGMASGRDRQLSNTSPARNSKLMMTPTTKVEQVHAEIGEPFVHHPGLAGGAKRVDIDVGDRPGRQDQPAVGEVPPQIRVQRRHRGQAEDGHEQERAEYDRAGHAAKPGGGHGQESNGPVTDFLRSARPAGAAAAPAPRSVAAPACGASARVAGRAGEAIPARARASSGEPAGPGPR